jgi:hypothetical protein
LRWELLSISGIQDDERALLMTQDHTVPKMYLKRFALETKPAKEWQISVYKKKSGKPYKQNVNRVSTISDFYLGMGLNGIQTHAMEHLLGVTEGEATKAFASMLDTDSGKPEEWPLPEDDRKTIATWIAMQMLRTKRVRKMLAYEQYGSKETDAVLKEARVKDDHLQFMYSRQAALTDEILGRRWGFGFCDTELITGDTPVVVLNGQDDPDGNVPFLECTVLIPLDPHRLIIMPAASLVKSDSRKRKDHLFKLPKGAAWGINHAVFGASDDSIYHHPNHTLDQNFFAKGFDIKTLWGGAEKASEPLWGINYKVMAKGEENNVFSKGDHVGVIFGEDESEIYLDVQALPEFTAGVACLKSQALQHGDLDTLARTWVLDEQLKKR